MSIAPIRECLPPRSGEQVTEALPGLPPPCSPLVAHGLNCLPPLALFSHSGILLSVIVLLRFSASTWLSAVYF